MSVAKKINDKLTSFSDYLRKSEKRAILAGGIIYSVLFLVFVLVYMLQDFLVTGAYLGGDGVAAYYPDLLEFRRAVINFFEGLKNGAPQLTFISTDFLYGTDVFISVYVPAFPFFALSALFPESAMPLFLTTATMIFTYLSGFSFMYLCRYFKKDMVWSGFFALFYVFCGNFFFTALFNIQFLYMYIAFPFMIVGMDRILTDKGGWIMLSLSVAWLAILGLPHIVYTVPFLVIYALIRVYFLYKKTFFKSLGKYFLRGSLSVILGFVICGFALLPYLISFFTSVRTSGGGSTDYLSLLIPSFDYALEFLKGEGIGLMTGVAAGPICCFLYLFTSFKTKKEVKCMSLVMLLLIIFPIIRYGLNNFTYDMCRWGFIPALFVAFCCVDYAPRLLRIKGREAKMFFFVLILYTLLQTFGGQKASVVFIFIMALINSVPALRKLTFKLAEKIKQFAVSIKDSKGKKSGLIPIIIVAAAITLVIGIVIYIILTKSFSPVFNFIVVACGTIILFLTVTADYKACAGVLLSVLYLASGLIFVEVGGASLITPSPEYEEAATLTHEENTFGRVALINSEAILREEAGKRKIDEPATEESVQQGNDLISQFGYGFLDDGHLNSAKRYNIASADAFQGIVNGEFMNFLKRCGMTPNALYSSVVVFGFDGREVLYSMFGFSDLIAGNSTDRFYGIEVDRKLDYSERDIYFYKNKYALPVGVTYDSKSFMNEERFNELNSAELPYAMFNDVYLEGYDAPEYIETEYSKEVDFDLKQDLRGETDFGIKCYDNYVTVNEPTGGQFVYLSFEGVRCFTFASMFDEPITVKVNDDYEYFYSVHNINSEWNWKISNDRYVLPLGCLTEDIKDIFFISPFEFESVKIYSVPESMYVDAYGERTEDILENVEISTNTITGDISLDEDKTLVISLLHNNGWSAYVDGEKVPTYKANGLFIGIPLTAGQHSIRLDYVSSYLVEGLIVSGAGVVIMIAVYVITKRKKAEKKEG